MGLFKRLKERKEREEAERIPLSRGVLSIVNAWEADVFRSRKEYADRAPRRAQFAAQLTDWVEEEVVRDGGMITDWDIYIEGLTEEIGEGMHDEDPELDDAMKASDNEQALIEKLTRNVLNFAQRLTAAERQGGEASVQTVLAEEEQKAELKTRENLTAP